MLYERALQLLRTAVRDPEAAFRNGQWEAIEALVNRRARLLVVERTGWGKSLVYFIATRLLRDAGAGPTILVSPLLALMRNQVDAAARIDVKAERIDSTNQDEWQAVTARLHRGEVDVLLVSPERLANDEFRERMLLPVAHGVALLVVDEAHCISDWGHDFRPDYRRITRILQALPRTVAVLATTATANDRVVRDIESQLGPNLAVIRGPLARASLRLQNVALPSAAARMAWLAENVPRLPGSGIIYTLTVRDAETVAGWLQSKGISAYPYHGDVKPSEKREALEDALLGNRVKALVATPALGMGYDKPDLGFVVHFQRPGSVVHYYQQVGRAGRAVSEAYGVLLGGAEDEDITGWFIRSAFPPEHEIRTVLDALDGSDEGLTKDEMQEAINLPATQIEKILKILATESPSPVVKRGSRWQTTAVEWEPDNERIDAVRRIREAEQGRMRAYQDSTTCLMAFLAEELNDPVSRPCGRCGPCMGTPVVSLTASAQQTEEAERFLRRRGIRIDPRKKWLGDTLVELGWRGNIPADLRAEPGWAVAQWNDAGWGRLVARGKYQDGRFADELVRHAAGAIRTTWNPQPRPAWVTCVPSRRHPELVPDFAARLAAALGLPFVPCIEKVRDTAPQKQMQNSYQQVRNLARAFRVVTHPAIAGPVLLVDDTVDSRWTFTVLAALLREAGSGEVFPFALAFTSAGGDA
ncbi:MAG TPA: RecQ family ATP-dependent DNA helicase [Longimicrobiaceae bacterium]|nr:RecQ family ATP-dependent DNA helicase [Longimicrobiaceae bacterium]